MIGICSRYAYDQAQYALLGAWLIFLTLGATALTAIAAAVSARIANQAFKATERPWVGLETVATPDGLVAGREIKAFAVIKNTGRTPAQKMQVAFKGYLLPKGETPREADTSQEPQKALFPSVLDYYRPFLGHPILFQIQLDAINRGDLVAWIVGRVDYSDGTGDRHKTGVRTRWDRTHGSFIPHDPGNDAT